MSSPAETASDPWTGFISWVRREPLQVLLIGLVLAVWTYFFGFYRVFMNGAESTAIWAWHAWNPENDLEYGGIILPAAAAIAWVHRDALRAAPKSTSWAGLVIALGGAILFVLAVRTLQPRLALMGLPALIYGGVRFLWGRATARIILFPCAFLLFMVPAGFLVSRTVGLQNLAATVAAKLSTLIGIGVLADGATLHAMDGSFTFEVAGGCSGIRSLTAMTMLAAVYVHFTQREWWKKAILFGGSLLFALLGNFVRIFSVVLVARFINPTLAGGLYHEWSGFIFFPIAVFSMLGVANLLNRDWSTWLKPETLPAPAATPAAAPRSERSEARPADGAKPSPVSYDY
jgi:exosortase